MDKVYIVGAGKHLYWHMFNNRNGYEPVTEIKDADIIVFTGGEDVDPAYYGQKPIQGTHFNPDRDRREAQVFEETMGKFRVGICRGAQFLNVLNGGSLWQDVDAHTKPHVLMDIRTGRFIGVTSTHHQMMIPAEHARVVATATESNWKYADGQKWEHESFRDDRKDYEVLWYPKTQSLCFQPHPEFIGAATTCDYFFNLLERYREEGHVQIEAEVQTG